MVVTVNFGCNFVLYVLRCTIATPPPRPDTLATCWKVCPGGVTSAIVASSPFLLSHVSVMASTSHLCSTMCSFTIVALFRIGRALIKTKSVLDFTSQFLNITLTRLAPLTQGGLAEGVGLVDTMV